MKTAEKDENREKREMERFDLGLSATMSAEGEDGKVETLNLKTANICSGGAFFRTDRALPLGTPVKMELVLPVADTKPISGNKTIVTVTGSVVRSEQGMAIQFDSKYKMYLFRNDLSSRVFEFPVHVVGQNRLQNELLARFLRDEAGLRCKCVGDEKSGAFPKTNGLLLFDCMGMEKEDALTCLPEEPDSDPGRCMTAFFNADHDPNFERESMSRNVRGVFYHDDSPEEFHEGVLSILKGELWFSRKTLSEGVSNHSAPRDESSILSNREIEVLILVTAGKTNKEIAKKLNRSVHTVKTHIYRIFKKVGVKNRFQASLWAAKYL